MRPASIFLIIQLSNSREDFPLRNTDVRQSHQILNGAEENPGEIIVRIYL